jgi:glutamate dehydrogenase
MERHRLRREIIATHVTNSMVDRTGTTFAFRLRQETGAPPAEIARAYTTAREVFDVPSLWTDVQALDDQVDVQTQVTMLLEARKLVDRATLWLLRHRRPPLDIAATVADFAPGAQALSRALPGILVDGDRQAWDERVEALTAAGVPPALASRVASLGAWFSALDVVEVADETGHDVGEVAALHFLLGARLHLHWLRDRVAALPREDRWQAMARGALRDDLFTLHSELTADVLREAPAEGDLEARVDAWRAANAAVVERCLSILADIRAGGTYDLTTLPVALREVRNLIHRTAPVPS